MHIITAMGIQDICGFGFMDPPKKDRVNHALHRLKNLGALDHSYRITVLGCQVRGKNHCSNKYINSRILKLLLRRIVPNFVNY